MIKTKVIGRVLRKKKKADQNYDMWIDTELEQGASPGLFV